MDSRQELFDELRLLLQTKRLRPHFQPIVNLNTAKVIAHEALIRGPVGSRLEMPNALFQTALEANLANELELLCRTLSIQQFATHQLSSKLFLNVSASLLKHSNHSKGFTVELLKRYGLSVDDIVIEISEQHPFDHHGVTNNAVNYYRDMGFKIAIDDLGAGYSGLKLWSELKPNLVKIDKHFIQGIDKDAVKREFVKAIYNISQSTGCEVLAEGIETYNELSVIQNIGIQLGQGYFLGYPTETPQDEYDFDPRIITGRLHSWPLEEKRETAASIVTHAPSVTLKEPISQVDRLFQQDHSLSVVPVLNGTRPIGVILRSELLELYSTQYGRALYERKPVTNIVNEKILVVELSMSLDDVSHLVTSDDESALLQEILVVDKGNYVGVCHVRDLLKRITDLKVINARHSNPLTLLPGNLPINRKIDELLKQRVDFRVAYFDLNNFKPFNDTQGYAKGDRVIRELGEILVKHAGKAGNFVGHIGGDDFVVIFQTEDYAQICQTILDDFDIAVLGYYDSAAIQASGVWSVDRKGQSMFFSLLSLSVGIIHPDHSQVPSHCEVAELAAKAKKQAKRIDQSFMYISEDRSLNVKTVA